MEEAPPSGRLSLSSLVWIYPSGHHTDINCFALLTLKDKQVSQSIPMGASETNGPPGQGPWERPGARSVLPLSPATARTGRFGVSAPRLLTYLCLHPRCRVRDKFRFLLCVFSTPQHDQKLYQHGTKPTTIEVQTHLFNHGLNKQLDFQNSSVLTYLCFHWDQWWTFHWSQDR